jgi:hypothetical protein
MCCDCVEGAPWSEPSDASNGVKGLAAPKQAIGERIRRARPDGSTMPDYDPVQLEDLMTAAFELLGKAEVQAQEFSKAILKAAERPRSDGQEAVNPPLR